MSAALTIDGLRLLHRYDTARKALAMWTEEKDKVRAELLNILGDQHEGFFDSSPVISVSRIHPRRFDLASFAADHPGMHEKYMVEAADPEVRVWVPKRLPPVPGVYTRFYDSNGVQP